MSEQRSMRGRPCQMRLANHARCVSPDTFPVRKSAHSVQGLLSALSRAAHVGEPCSLERVMADVAEVAYLRREVGGEGVVEGYKLFLYKRTDGSLSHATWEIRRIYDQLRIKHPFFKWWKNIQEPRF